MPPPAAPAHRPPAGALATLVGLVVLIFLGIACWITASHPRGSRAAGPLAATPQAASGGSLLSSGPFQESITTIEQPEIRITDTTDDGEISTVIFTDAAGAHLLEVRKPSSSITLAPGEYQWELRGARYRHMGIPDQTGTLVCRRFRRYDLRIFIAGPDDHSDHPRLGDQ